MTLLSLKLPAFDCCQRRISGPLSNMSSLPLERFVLTPTCRGTLYLPLLSNANANATRTPTCLKSWTNILLHHFYSHLKGKLWGDHCTKGWNIPKYSLNGWFCTESNNLKIPYHYLLHIYPALPHVLPREGKILRKCPNRESLVPVRRHSHLKEKVIDH